MVLDAVSEILRVAGIVRDIAVLTVVAIHLEGNRRILDVFLAMKEAELHWRAFLDCHVNRGIRGVGYIGFDDYPELKAARRPEFTGFKRQRCEHYLAQDALKQALGEESRKCISDLRIVCNDESLNLAEVALENVVTKSSSETPTLAKWIEKSS